MNILLKSVKIVAQGNKNLHLKVRDIFIKNGIIEKIAAKIDAPKNTKIIEEKNLHVSEGWLDTSVSFGEPGYEERETIDNGIDTAGKSGFTDIVLNPDTNPAPDSSSDIVFFKNAAKGFATSVHPLGALSQNKEGIDMAELFDMKNAGAVGFSDYKKTIENPNLLKIALLYAQNFGGLVYSFPKENSIAGKGSVNEGATSTRLGLKGIPALAEELQVARDLFILEYTGGKLHIPTISTVKSVKLIAEAKKKGLNISCSVAIHNLCFTDDVLENFDSNYKVMPPLRSKQDIKALIKGVEQGVIDFVTSDHSPMNIEQKRVEFDNAAYGTIGLESAFGVLNKLFGMEKTIALLTSNKERYTIENSTIRVGNKANLTLFDSETEYSFSDKNIASTSKNSMFIGETLKGKAVGVIANGKLNLA